MLRPQDTATRERKAPRRAVAVPPRRRRRRARRAVVRRAAARTRGRWPCRRATTTSSPTPAVRDHVGDVWYQRDGARAARLGGRADRPALRVGHAPGHGLGRRRRGRPARGRLHAVRGRRHRGTCRRARRCGSPSCVDNTLSFQTIPPGVVEETPAGRRQRYWHDFFNYAGLHRTVWLACTPAAHDRRRHRRHRPRRHHRHGRLPGRRRRRRRPRGAGRAARRRRRARSRTGDRRGGQADRARRAPLGARRRLPLRPRGPAASTAGALVDSYHQTVGVRTVEVRGTEFLINGEPFYFTGFGKHEDHPTPRQGPQRRVPGPRLRAAGVDRRQLVPHLALPLLRGGPRLRRPARHRGHRRDRRGRAEHGPRRRHLRRAGLHDVLADETINDETREVHAQAIRELVARDKNHPSVVLWSIANEPESDTAEARGLLPTAVRRGPRGRPDPAGRLRQRDARARTASAGCRSSPTS